MSSHPRSGGGPPSLMDDAPDFDRNMNSLRFDGGRGGRGGRGGPGGGMRGRGGGEGGFGHRGGPRGGGGGRGDFHHRDRFPHGHNMNRSDDDNRGGPPKMPGLFDLNQAPPRPFDRDHNGGGRGRMPYSRGGGRDGPHDDRFRHSGPRTTPNEGPPSILDFSNDKQPAPSSNSGALVPSLFSVQLENSGSTTLPDSNKPTDPQKDQHQSDESHGRSEHSSHRDNDNRHRERDSRKHHPGGYDRSSSFNRDRSRSPRDRDRDRHSSSRDDRPFGGDHRRMGGNNSRGGRGSDHFGRGARGNHHNNPRDSYQSRFGPEQSQGPWQDRRDGGGRRGNFHDRPRDMGGHHHRLNEQSPSDNNHPFSRDGRPNFNGPPQSRPFQEGNFPPGNFEPMGPHGQNRSNFNQGPLLNRPDFYGSNNNKNNNPGFPPHNTRSGGRPSRFSDRQDEYDDERPLTKPNLPLPNVPTTTPLYMNQPNNPTFSQARQPLNATFSSQQVPPNMFPNVGSTPGQGSGSQFPWSNQQGPAANNPQLNQSLIHSGSNDQINSLVSTTGSSNNAYGSNPDFHRQAISTNTNPFYAGVPPVAPQGPNNKPSTVNAPNMALSQNAATAAANPAATPNMNAELWRNYYQYCQAMQQQTAGAQAAAHPFAAYPWLSQAQTASASTTAAGVKGPGAGSTTNSQDPAATQGNAEAWAQFYCMQYQAYLQQHAQMANAASTTVPNAPVTITAPSQLYSKSTGKP